MPARAEPCSLQSLFTCIVAALTVTLTSAAPVPHGALIPPGEPTAEARLASKLDSLVEEMHALAGATANSSAMLRRDLSANLSAVLRRDLSAAGRLVGLEGQATPRAKATSLASSTSVELDEADGRAFCDLSDPTLGVVQRNTGVDLKSSKIEISCPNERPLIQAWRLYRLIASASHSPYEVQVCCRLASKLTAATKATTKASGDDNVAACSGASALQRITPE